MYFEVYVSSATRPFTKAELTTLLTKARQTNENLGITGLLLYKDGNFMQTLEGEEHAIKALVAKIGQDPRHKGIITLLKGEKADREFAGWSMAFRDLQSPEAARIPGYSEFLNTPLNDKSFTENPSRSSKLLKLFKEKM